MKPICLHTRICNLHKPASPPERPALARPSSAPPDATGKRSTSWPARLAEPRHTFCPAPPAPPPRGPNLSPTPSTHTDPCGAAPWTLLRTHRIPSHPERLPVRPYRLPRPLRPTATPHTPLTSFGCRVQRALALLDAARGIVALRPDPLDSLGSTATAALTRQTSPPSCIRSVPRRSTTRYPRDTLAD